MNKLDKMLADARANRTWGEIVITLKEGVPILLKQTIQVKVEENPATYERK